MFKGVDYSLQWKGLNKQQNTHELVLYDTDPLIFIPTSLHPREGNILFTT